MKLSPEQIGTIEALLTLRERGVNQAEISKRLGLGQFGQQKLSNTFRVLDSLGLDVPVARRGRKPGGRNHAKHVAAKPAIRVFLSADQWQERLSALVIIPPTIIAALGFVLFALTRLS